MAQFLSKITLWVLVLTITACVLQETQSSRSKQWFPPNLILGDSHAGPVKLKSFANLSHAGDPLFVQILKGFRHCDRTQQKPRFVTCILGPHNFSPLSELRIDQNYENWRSSGASRLAALAKVEEYLHWMPPAVWIEAWMKEFTLPKHERLSAQDVFKTSYQNNADERIERHLVSEAGWFLERSHTWHSLSQLVELTATWNAQLLLLETPRHEHYESLVFPSDLEEYRRRLATFADRHLHVTFIPSNRFTCNTEWFGDSDHLNSFGASCLNQAMMDEAMLPSEWGPFLHTTVP